MDYQMNSVWFDEAELNSRNGTLLCEIVPLLVAKQRAIDWVASTFEQTICGLSHELYIYNRC